MPLDIIESYDEYILRRSQGKSAIHWASAMGKTIADQYGEESFLLLNSNNSVLDCYCLKKDSATSIRVVSRLNNVDFVEGNLSFDELLDNKGTQSWWKSVFFENQGVLLYDSYYDSFRVSDNHDFTFGALLEKITGALSHIISRVAKYRFDTLYIPKEFFLNLPLRYVLQTRVCNKIRILPELQLISDERQFVLQRYDTKNVPILSIAGGIPVTQLIELNEVFVHLPLDDQSFSSHLVGSKTWKDVLVKTPDFTYQINGLTFQIVKLNAQVDVFSNLFLTLSSGKWKTSIIVNDCH